MGVGMDGQATIPGLQSVAAQLLARLKPAGADRVALAVGTILAHAFAVLDDLNPTEAEFEHVLQFLTDVGYATDARRQEWVLLADVFGLSSHVARQASGRAAGRASAGTPSALAGPFYRPDAPRLAHGANLSRDGVGQPLTVMGQVRAVDGAPVSGAEVEVWHANEMGRYENQDPDSQPEHNLRGRFVTDNAGRFFFRTVRPGGYSLPDDGPVGRMARRLGLSLDRPAHIHFAVTAPGFRPLVTAIFDGSDKAIDRDALFAVRPALIGNFDHRTGSARVDVRLVLDPTRSATSH
jgi:hydroxyquinol 1,2-dioxygenase